MKSLNDNPIRVSLLSKFSPEIIKHIENEGFEISNNNSYCNDAKSVGGSGIFQRQSSKPFIGMKVEFITNNDIYGFNFKII